MHHVVVNPVGGKGASLKALEILKERFEKENIEYKVYITQYPKHGIEIVKELTSNDEEKSIILLGGDGSFNDALCGIDNFDNLTIGLIPCGSGNDFIKKAEVPLDTNKAIDAIINGNTKYVDYMELGNHRCLNVAGGGMDVDVLLKYQTVKKLKGKAAYYYSLFYTLLHTRFHKLRLTIDDNEPIERNVFMIGIGNGGYIGGGLPICPNAKPDDGLLNVVGINEVKKYKIPLLLGKFLSGKHVNMFFSEEFNGKKIKLEALDDSMFELDGEIVEDRVLDISVVPNKLKIYI